MFDSEVTPLFSLAEFVFDAAVGAVAMIAIVGFALTLGGFMFFTPWLIVAPPIMFAAGALRGSGARNIWIKSLSITSGALLLFVGFSDTNPLTVATAFFVAVIPTAGGIWFRRRSSGREAEGPVHKP